MGIAGHFQKVLTLALVAGAIIGVSLPAAAAPGEPDLGFGAAGRATTDFGVTPGPTSHDYARGLLLNPDESIVLAGTIETSAGTKTFALSKYTPSGALDSSFGSGGKTVTAFANAGATALAVARQPDGKIVIAGGVAQNAGNGVVAVARYTASGVLDTSFAEGGRVTTDLSVNEDYASGIAVQPDGKIVVGATAGTSFAAVRYNTNGTLDTSFGNSGKIITGFPGLQADAAALALQPDGGIVVVGTVDDGLDVFNMAVARYTPAGTIDTTFGSGGTTVIDVSNGYDFAYAVLPMPDGKLVIAGQADVSARARMALVRLTSIGVLDTSFGTGGKTTTDFTDMFGGSPYTMSSATAVAIQGGRLVAGGFAGAAGYSFALARYSIDGTLDTSFGNAGRVASSFGGFDDEIRGLAAQPDGRILAAGYSYQGSYDFALARYGIAYPAGADLHPLVSSGDTSLGSSVSIQATARNEGPEPASNVSLTVTLPAAATFVSAAPSQGSCTSSAGTVTCQLGSVPVGQATVAIVATATGAGTLLTSASVASSTADPYAPNSTTSAASRVRASAGSYDSGQAQPITAKDALGNSKASASGFALPSGSLRADTAASSEMPVGANTNGIMVGYATATESAQVLKSFPATGPILSVTAVVNSQSQTVAGITAPRIADVRDGAATVHANVRAWFYPCASVTQCAPSASAANGLVVSQPGLSRPSVTISLTVRPPSGFTGVGILLVGAGLTSTSKAVGACSSSARTTGTVAQILVT